MSKLTITIREFKRVERGTLRGFATIHIDAMRLTIRDVGIHEKGDSRWAALPGKPQVGKDGTAIRDARTGKLAYTAILEFDSKPVRDAFSAAVIAALLDFDPYAFEQEAAHA